MPTFPRSIMNRAYQLRVHMAIYLIPVLVTIFTIVPVASAAAAVPHVEVASPAATAVDKLAAQYGPKRLLLNINSHKCVDVAGGNMGNNANVQQYRCHGGLNQQWQITSGGASGVVVLKSTQSGKCVDVNLNNNNVQMFTCHGGSNQQWLLRSTGSNYEFEMVNVYTGKCADVVWGSTSDGANIQVYSCHGGPNQRWKWLWTS